MLKHTQTIRRLLPTADELFEFIWPLFGEKVVICSNGRKQWSYKPVCGYNVFDCWFNFIS